MTHFLVKKWTKNGCHFIGFYTFLTNVLLRKLEQKVSGKVTKNRVFFTFEKTRFFSSAICLLFGNFGNEVPKKVVKFTYFKFLTF